MQEDPLPENSKLLLQYSVAIWWKKPNPQEKK